MPNSHHPEHADRPAKPPKPPVIRCPACKAPLDQATLKAIHAAVSKQFVGKRQKHTAGPGRGHKTPKPKPNGKSASKPQGISG